MLFSKRVPPKAREAFKKDSMSGMLVAVMSGLTAPFVAVIARDMLHASAFEIGVITMSPLAGNLLSLFFCCVMEGRRKMPFAVALWVISRILYVLIFFAKSSAAFVGIIAASSIIGSLAGPAYSVLIREIYPGGDRARIMGYVRVCTWSVYVVITALAARILNDESSYRFVFPIAGFFGVASALVFGIIPTSDASGDSNTKMTQFVRDSVLILHEDRAFRWFCAGIFLFGFGSILVQPIFIIYQVDTLGVKSGWAGIYSIITSIVMIVASLYWGSYVDRKRPENVIAMQGLAWAVIPLFYCVATKPWMLIPVAIIGGIIGIGMELSYFNGVLHFAPKDRVTQYQAVFAALTGLRGVIAPYIGTALIDYHIMPMKSVFVLTTGIIVASVAVQLAGAQRHYRPVAVAE